MSMTRREFGKYLAILAAGAAATSAQLETFERLYDVNLPQVASGLLQINDYWIGFRSPRDAAVRVCWTLGPNHQLPIVLNQRATLRYVPAPDCPMLTTVDAFAWTLEASVIMRGDATESVQDEFEGALRFTDQNGRIHDIAIDGRRRRLVEYLT